MCHQQTYKPCHDQGLAQAADRGFPQGSQLLEELRNAFSFLYTIVSYHHLYLLLCSVGDAYIEAFGGSSATMNVCCSVQALPHKLLSAEGQDKNVPLNVRLTSSRFLPYEISSYHNIAAVTCLRSRQYSGSNRVISLLYNECRIAASRGIPSLDTASRKRTPRYAYPMPLF
jgi:hypothetical protein